jgi:AraC-like DNA-binding protein
VSESRLIHLFKKETGTTIRKYILWNKLQQAIKFHLLGNSLKQSASLSGFTDAAHFNRVFVSNYGINPSSMLK